MIPNVRILCAHNMSIFSDVELSLLLEHTFQFNYFILQNHSIFSEVFIMMEYFEDSILPLLYFHLLNTIISGLYLLPHL